MVQTNIVGDNGGYPPDRFSRSFEGQINS